MSKNIPTGMKILYIITQADGGGAQKYVLSLAKHFRGSIAAGNEAKKLFDDARNLQLKTYNLKHLKRDINPWHDFWAMWEIRNLIKNMRPDIVHLNSTKAGILGSFACIGLKTKVLFTAHGFRFLEPLSHPAKMFYLALEKVASSYRDFIIAVSDADKKAALENKIIDRDKIQPIHNGIGQIDFLPRREARKKLGLSEDKFIFGTIANFYKTKGLDILIDAVAILDDDLKARCLFAIIGDGNERKNLELGIRHYGLQKHIILLGKINDASKYLKAFDCLIIPSKKEGFPYAVLEAIQAGLPIIAANVGGIPEALGEAGLLIPAHDSKALANATNTIIHSSMIVNAYSQKALERSKFFTEEKMLSETEKIYQNLLN